MWIAFKYFLRWVGSRVAEQEPLRLHGQLDARREGDPAHWAKWGEYTIKHKNTIKIWSLLIHNYVQISMQGKNLFVGLRALIKTLECHLLFGIRTSRRARKRKLQTQEIPWRALFWSDIWSGELEMGNTCLSNPSLETSHTTYLIVKVHPKSCKGFCYFLTLFCINANALRKTSDSCLEKLRGIGSCNFHLWLIFGQPSPSPLASCRFWPNLSDLWGKF